MASRKDRKPKSALNQGPVSEPVVEEKPVEAKITISGTEFVAHLNKEKVEEPVEQSPIETSVEEEPKLTFVNEPIEIDIMGDDEVEEEKPPRTLESLTKAEMRWFQRTGMMPK